ncbi:MAG: glycogen/starch synthase [Flavobacteriales bacterium]
MGKSRILYVSQEISPYLPESHMSEIGRYLPQHMLERGNEIRTFMPRFGCINERRHQLHEVIRLSGINLIIDDSDHPLIIKVASIQQARMQVYFIDNEEYFHRKAIFKSPEGRFYGDNDERITFFCRGVIETVIKLGWAPEIIHCHGWFTSLLPLYIKKSYSDNPLFANSKVVYSVYDDGFKGQMSKGFPRKVMFENIDEDNVKSLSRASYADITDLAIAYSDAVIIDNAVKNKSIKDRAISDGKPVMEGYDEDDYLGQFEKFYEEVLETNSLLVE